MNLSTECSTPSRCDDQFHFWSVPWSCHCHWGCYQYSSVRESTRSSSASLFIIKLPLLVPGRFRLGRSRSPVTFIREEILYFVTFTAGGVCQCVSSFVLRSFVGGCHWVLSFICCLFCLSEGVCP